MSYKWKLRSHQSHLMLKTHGSFGARTKFMFLVPTPKLLDSTIFLKDLRKKGTDPTFSLGETELPLVESESASIKRDRDHVRSRATHAGLTALEISGCLGQGRGDFDTARGFLHYLLSCASLESLNALV